MLVYVARDAVIFALFGLILGFIIDFLFVDPDVEESIIESIFYILLQVVICTAIVYYIGKAYEGFFGYDPDSFSGLTMFTVIFFIVQVQLFERVSLLFHKITGRKLPNGL